MKSIVITLDGFSGCGKSATAMYVAKALQYEYLDTGAMYRAVSYALLSHGIEADQQERIRELLPTICIKFVFDAKKKENRTFLNEKDISKEIRSTEVTGKVSQLSRIKFIRDFLLIRQREIGAKKSIVAEGRDMGTRVFVEAELKIFMTADIHIRAQRRFDEYKEKGIKTTFEEVYSNLKMRDAIDTTRSLDPLKPAPDAMILDTSSHSLSSQAEYIIEEAKKRIQL